MIMQRPYQSDKKVKMSDNKAALVVTEMHSQEVAEREVGDDVTISWNSDSFVAFV